MACFFRMLVVIPNGSLDRDIWLTMFEIALFNLSWTLVAEDSTICCKSLWQEEELHHFTIRFSSYKWNWHGCRVVQQTQASQLMNIHLERLAKGSIFSFHPCHRDLSLEQIRRGLAKLLILIHEYHISKGEKWSHRLLLKIDKKCCFFSPYQGLCFNQNVFV